MWPAHFFAFVPFRALSFHLLKFHELLAQLAQPMVALKAGSMSSSSDTNTPSAHFGFSSDLQRYTASLSLCYIND